MNNLELLVNVKDLNRYQRIIESKALSPADMAYDPDALDGDGDGLIQDSTPFERPAIIKIISTTAQAMSNTLRELSRLRNRTSRQQYRSRHRDMTNSDIANSVVPSSIEETARLLAQHAIGSLDENTSPDQVLKFINKGINDITGGTTGDPFDYTPRKIRRLREALTSQLDASPQFRALVDRYGMPPMMLLRTDADLETSFSGIHYPDFIIGIPADELGKGGGINTIGNRLFRALANNLSPYWNGGNDKSKRWTLETGLESVIRHEFSHHIQASLYHDIKDAGNARQTKLAEYILNPSWTTDTMAFPGLSPKKERVQGDVFAKYFDEPEWDKLWFERGDLPDEIPSVHSMYGETSPIEQFAEGLSGLMSPDKSARKRVSGGFETMVQELMGLDVGRSFADQLDRDAEIRQPIEGFGSRGFDPSVPQGNLDLWHPTTKEMSPKQLAEHQVPLDTDGFVDALVNEHMIRNPRLNEADTVVMIEEHFKSLFGMKDISELPEYVDFGYSAALRKDLEGIHSDNPAPLLHHRQYGAPPFVRVTEKGFAQMDRIGVGGDFEAMFVTPVISDIGFIALAPQDDQVDETRAYLNGRSLTLKEMAIDPGEVPLGTKYPLLGSTLDDTYRHEYGHYIHATMVGQLPDIPTEGSKERRRLLRGYHQDDWGTFFAVVGRPDWQEAHDKRHKKIRPKDYPEVNSLYAWSAPPEQFAEAYSAHTSPDPYMRGAISPEMARQMDVMLGLDDQGNSYGEMLASDDSLASRANELDEIRKAIAPIDDPTTRDGVRPHLDADGNQAKTWDGKDVWETDNASNALSLIAAGEHVYVTDWNEQVKLMERIGDQFKLYEEGQANGTGWDRNQDGIIDEKDDIPVLNACLFMTRDANGNTNNMFCDNHSNILRLSMPQVGGTVTDDQTKAIRAWKAGLTTDTGGAHDAFIGKNDINKSTFAPGTKLFDELSETFAKDIAKERAKAGDKPFTDADVANVIYAELSGNHAKKNITDEHKAIFFDNVDFTKVEPNVTAEFIQMLAEKNIKTDATEGVDVASVHATQNGLQLNKMSGIAKTMRAQFAKYWETVEAIRADKTLTDDERATGVAKAKAKWLGHFINAPIIVSIEGAIFDGHHRAYARHIFEAGLTDDQLADLNDGMKFQIRKTDATVSELLELGKAFQDIVGVAAADIDPNKPKWETNSIPSDMTPGEWTDFMREMGSAVEKHVDKQNPEIFWTLERTETSPAVQRGRGTSRDDRIRTSISESGDVNENMGFASRPSEPKPVKTYAELKTSAGKQRISRAEMFEGASDEQIVRLSTPETVDELVAMSLDHMLASVNIDKMRVRRGLRKETVEGSKHFDTSDPTNIKALHKDLEAIVPKINQLMDTVSTDFSPEAVRQAREMVQTTLDASPALRHMIETYGMPPVVIGTQEGVSKAMISAVTDKRFDKSKFMEIMNGVDISAYYKSGDKQDLLDSPQAVKRIRQYFMGPKEDGPNPFAGGYFPGAGYILVWPGSVPHRAFTSGEKMNRAHVAKKGDWNVTDLSVEATLLHEYGHYIDHIIRAKIDTVTELGETMDKTVHAAYMKLHGLENSVTLRMKRADPAFTSTTAPLIDTSYGTTNQNEMIAEAVAAVLSGNASSMSMLNKTLTDDIYALLGIKSVEDASGRKINQIPWSNQTNRTLTTPGFASRGEIQYAAAGATLSELKETKKYKKLKPETLSVGKQKYKLVHASVSEDIFNVEKDGRVVGELHVGENITGEPTVTHLAVHGNHKNAGLEKELVTYAQHYYPQLSVNAKRTTEGFASRDLPTGLTAITDSEVVVDIPEGTPGTPEYVISLAASLKQAKKDRKTAIFDYNNATRRVDVEEIYEKDGLMYLRGFDQTRQEGRTFRLDRVSTSYTVPVSTEKAQIARPEKLREPRKAVAPYTGSAAAIFDGVSSYREAHERFSKGEYVFFDFETTGIVSDDDGAMKSPGVPVQIGVIRVVDGKIVERLNLYMAPDAPLSQWSRDNLKRSEDGVDIPLTDEWLATQPSRIDILTQALEFIGEGKTMGGQYQIFDQNVFEEQLKELGLEHLWKPAGFVDSKGVIDHLYPPGDPDAPRNNRLKTLTEQYGVPFDNWHDASADSEASWRVIDAALRLAAEREERGETISQGLKNTASTTAAHENTLAKYRADHSEWRSKVRAASDAAKKAEKDAASDAAKDEKDGNLTKISSGSPKLKIVGQNTGVNEFFNGETRLVVYGEGAKAKRYLLVTDGESRVLILDYEKSGPLNGMPGKSTPGAWIVGVMETWLMPNLGYHEIFNIQIKDRHQRRGLGSAVMKFHRDRFPELNLHHSSVLSEEGKAFAQNATPESFGSRADASIVPNVSARPTGYRVGGTKWTDLGTQQLIETERGNVFPEIADYPDHEAIWVAHDERTAGRYGVAAEDVDAYESGEFTGDISDIESVDLTGATLVQDDGDDGYLYVRPKNSDGFASRGDDSRHPVTGNMSVDEMALHMVPEGRGAREPARGALQEQLLEHYLQSRKAVDDAVRATSDARFKEILDDWLLGKNVNDPRVKARIKQLEGDHRKTQSDLDADREAWGRKEVEIYLKTVFDLGDLDDLSTYINVNEQDNERLRKTLRDSLVANPQLLELYKQHGAPIVVMMTKGGPHIDSGERRWGTTGGWYYPDTRMNVIVISGEIVDGTNRQHGPYDPPESAHSPLGLTKWQTSVDFGIVYAHESGHFLHHKLLDDLKHKKNNGEILTPLEEERDLLLRAYLGHDWYKYFGKLDRPDWEAAYDSRETEGFPSDYPYVDSLYAFSTPLEMLAEAFAAATSSDADMRNTVSPEMMRHLNVMFGIGETLSAEDEVTLLAQQEEATTMRNFVRRLRRKGSAAHIIDYENEDENSESGFGAAFDARLDELEKRFGPDARAGVEMWYGKGGFANDGRTESMRDDVTAGKSSREVDALVNLIAVSPDAEKPLYRGMMLSKEELAAILSEGTINFPIGAFSGRRSTASEYTGLNLDGGANGVIFVLESGRAFPMHLFSPVDEDEYLVGGRYTITNVEQAPIGRYDQTVTQITLSPTGRLPDTDSKKGTKSLEERGCCGPTGGSSPIWAENKVRNFYATAPTQHTKNMVSTGTGYKRESRKSRGITHTVERVYSSGAL